MTMGLLEPPLVTVPRADVPDEAWDAHSHIFGPFKRFPPRHPSLYDLPNATAAQHVEMRARLGVQYGVVVQPGPYGDDPSALLAAITSSGGTLRGVAVASGSIPTATLKEWYREGIRGLRFVSVLGPGGQRYPGSVGFEELVELAPRMRTIGLHAEIWGTSRQLVEALPGLLQLGLPLVIDHMGMVDVERGLEDPDTATLLRLMGDPRVWVKLAVCRVARTPEALKRLRPIHDAMVRAAPERCVWGSDWPYVRLDPAPDAGALLDLFLEWVPDPRQRAAILVDNPARLYRLPLTQGEK